MALDCKEPLMKGIDLRIIIEFAAGEIIIGVSQRYQKVV
jgi:hypothetical protein